MSWDFVLRDGTVVFPDRSRETDLLIRNEKIGSAKPGETVASDPEHRSRPARLLGLIDAHVHFGLSREGDVHATEPGTRRRAASPPSWATSEQRGVYRGVQARVGVREDPRAHRLRVPLPPPTSCISRSSRAT
jgi:hypothetical protein